MKKILIALIFSIGILAACSEETSVVDTFDQNEIQSFVKQSKSSGVKYDVSKFERYPLQEVIDGDTIRIKYNGSSEKIRFLLVDTPETNHETLGEQPYGPEAKQFVKELLKNEKEVYIEFDVSYRDKYKRLLAYIYTKDGISVQEELLKNGLARVAYVYAPNTKHVNWFKSVQAKAQKAAIGIWSVEDYVTNRGFVKEVYYEAVKNNQVKTSNNETDDIQKDQNQNNSNDACTIKGNINAKGNKIYHMPGQRDYERTNPEEMFCSEEDARAAGFVPALN